MEMRTLISVLFIHNDNDNRQTDRAALASFPVICHNLNFGCQWIQITAPCFGFVTGCRVGSRIYLLNEETDLRDT
jgi:hypothetical protein